MISYQQNNKLRDIFARNKISALQYFWAIILSIVLIVADNHYKYLHVFRSGFSLVISPVQYVVDYPVRVFGWVHSLVRSKKALVDENVLLKYKQTMLQNQLQKFLILQKENSKLRELLLTASDLKSRVMAAQILAVDTTESRQVLILNKGSKDGAYIGQPIFDASGVMGKLVDVGYKTSTLLLISDAKSAIPVVNERTSERGILVGTNKNNQLSLINMSKTAAVKEGDLLLTSGLGRVYPEGYPVAVVTKVGYFPGDEFITVFSKPLASLNKNRLVLLVWHDQSYAKLTAEIQERLNGLQDRG